MHPVTEQLPTRRSPQLAVVLLYSLKLTEVTKKQADEGEKNKENHYLLQCHDSHQLSNTGDIGMTETQQREESVGLSNDREKHMMQSVLNVSDSDCTLLAWLHCFS